MRNRLQLRPTLAPTAGNRDRWLKVDSDDALRYLTPVLGPTSVLVAHQSVRLLANTMAHVTVDADEFASRFGINRSQLERSIMRLVRFNVAQMSSADATNEPMTVVFFAVKLPPLPDHWVSRMPTTISVACPYSKSNTITHEGVPQ